MKRDKMYPERVGNISAFRGCDYSCSYCAFRTSLRRSSCEKCREFEPHAHLEVLNKRPPETTKGQFITIGLTGDISCASDTTIQAIIHYCWLWPKHTFLIQSKNPALFLEYKFPENVILGTTIESDIVHQGISKAPGTRSRFDAMIRVKDCRKMVTIEPIMDFTISGLLPWIRIIDPEFIYVGYDSRPDKNRLPEPSLERTQLFIKKMRDEGFDVREKLIRKAWCEK